MLYTYVRKKSPSSIRCYYIPNPGSAYAGWAREQLVRPAAQALSANYGITLQPLPFGEWPPAPKPATLTYILYGPTNPLEMTATEESYLRQLAALGYRVNLLSAYPLGADNRDLPGYVQAATKVPQLCAELAINAIFPDTLDTTMHIRTNDWQDIYANVLSETIRVKYQPVHSRNAKHDTLLEQLHEQHAADIDRLAKLHAELRLWQRTPQQNGAIFFVHDNYWYVTQTLTDKTTMTPANYDLISSFDEAKRTVTYSGTKLPTSDAPEFLVLSSLMDSHGAQPKVIVHFHHNELTRGSRYRELVTKDKIETGLFATGHHYFGHLQSVPADWFIAREHGVVWTGQSVADFERFIRSIL